MIWIETKQGKIRQETTIAEMRDGVVSIEYGWWYPEKEAMEPGLGGKLGNRPLGGNGNDSSGANTIELQRFDFLVHFCWQPTTPSDRRNAQKTAEKAKDKPGAKADKKPAEKKTDAKDTKPAEKKNASAIFWVLPKNES